MVAEKKEKAERVRRLKHAVCKFFFLPFLPFVEEKVSIYPENLPDNWSAIAKNNADS
jgi:hypothetical protein